MLILKILAGWFLLSPVIALLIAYSIRRGR